MNWDQAEDAIRSHIEAQWALSAHSSIPLFFENEDWIEGQDSFVYVDMQGVFADKTIFGGTGLRMSVESGIVFFHAFIGKGRGKRPANQLIVTMTQLLELRTISNAIDLEGGAPPSPVEDDSLISGVPGGNYFRCSGSVPFIVRNNI